MVRDDQRLLQPGEYWTGVDVATDPAFQVHGPVRGKAPQATPQERLFNRAMYAAEMAHRQGFPITPQTLHSENGDIPLHMWQTLLASEKIQLGLEERGIPLTNAQGLTPEQLSAAAIFLDTSSQMTRRQRLKAAGVTEQKWQGWMRQPLFAQYVGETAEEIHRNVTPVALQRIAEAVDAGERWAIELSLEINKRHDRRGGGVDTNQLLVAIFTALDEAGVPADAMARAGAAVKRALGGSPTPQVVLATTAATIDVEPNPLQGQLEQSA